MEEPDGLFVVLDRLEVYLQPCGAVKQRETLELILQGQKGETKLSQGRFLLTSLGTWLSSSSPALSVIGRKVTVLSG